MFWQNVCNWWVGGYLHSGNCSHWQTLHWLHLLMPRPTKLWSALSGNSRLLISLAGILRRGPTQATQLAANSHLGFTSLLGCPVDRSELVLLQLSWMYRSHERSAAQWIALTHESSLQLFFFSIKLNLKPARLLPTVREEVFFYIFPDQGLLNIPFLLLASSTLIFWLLFLHI